MISISPFPARNPFRFSHRRKAGERECIAFFKPLRAGRRISPFSWRRMGIHTIHQPSNLLGCTKGCLPNPFRLIPPLRSTVRGEGIAFAERMVRKVAPQCRPCPQACPPADPGSPLSRSPLIGESRGRLIDVQVDVGSPKRTHPDVYKNLRGYP